MTHRLVRLRPLVCLLLLASCDPADSNEVDAAAPVDASRADGGAVDAASGADAAMSDDAGVSDDAGPGLVDAGPTDAGTSDAGGAPADGGPASDAGPGMDGGDSDAGASDGGPPPSDAGAPDAGAPDAGAPDAGAPDAGSPPFDACSELDCSTASADVCVDATTLRSATATGTCGAGMCRETTSLTTCADACEEGACVSAASCGGAPCTTPGGRTCVSAQDIRVPHEIGACAAGTCDYAGWDATCSGGCAGSACAPDSWLTHLRDPDRAFWTCMAIDPEDRPHIFYFGAAPSGGTLVETTLTAEGWVSRDIETSIGGAGHSPLHCAIDRTGTAHVVYEDSVSTSVRYARRAPGGAWGVEFIRAGGTRAYALVMRDLSPIALFLDGASVIAAERGAGGWVELRRTSGAPANVVAALDSRGELVIAVTTVSRTSSGEPTSSRLGLPDASAGWTFENTTEVGYIDDMHIDRATDTIHVTLSNLGPAFMDVHTRTSAGAWSEVLVGGSLGDGRQGSLEVAADGTMHVTFVGRCVGGASGYGLCHATGGPGGFTLERASDALYGRSVSLALDSAGVPHIAGADDSSSDDLIYVRPFD